MESMGRYHRRFRTGGHSSRRFCRLLGLSAESQWGIESSASENPNLQQMGANVMNHLSRSGLQTKEDASLIFETALVPSNDSLTDEFDASLVERAKQRDNEHEGRYNENTESANEGGEQHG